jgi:phosphatidylinositol glycan class V
MHEWYLLRFASITRLFLILWTIVTNLLIINYDSSQFVSGVDKGKEKALLSQILDPFAHWDALYFLRIAKMGFYEYEHFHAFFPMYPISIRYIAICIRYIFPIMSVDESLMLSGVLLSNLCFIASVLVMYRLSSSLFNDSFAYTAAKIYAITPASIFMSAIYTESMFALFSLTGMYLIVKSEDYTAFHWLYIYGSTIFFFLATLTRGNGIVCCGFFLYYFMLLTRKLFVETSAHLLLRTVKFLIHLIFSCLSPCLIILSAYVLFQWYAYMLYCSKEGNLHAQKMSDDWNQYLANTHPWCLKSLPHIYTYVQSQYWNVGFLKYYELKQIPNFLLASPIIGTSLVGIYSYMRHKPQRLLTLALSTGKYQTNSFYQCDRAFAFVCYWTFLTLTCLFTMHIQVSTRFMASCPPIYWFLTQLIQRPERKTIQTVEASIVIRLLGLYFVLYFLIGPVLFGNFYPWT